MKLKDAEVTHCAKKEVFLPEAAYALKNDKFYVFDFSSEQFVGAPIQDAASKEADSYFVENGKGDIAWKDGGLLGLRNGKLVVSKGQEKNIQCVDKEWCNWYRLSKETKLPLMLDFVTSAGVNYELTIKKISKDGIAMEYQKKP